MPGGGGASGERRARTHSRRAGRPAPVLPTWAPKLRRPSAPGGRGAVGRAAQSSAPTVSRRPAPVLIQLGRPSCAGRARREGREPVPIQLGRPAPVLIQLGRPSCAAGSLPVQAPASGKSGSGPAHGREPAPSPGASHLGAQAAPADPWRVSAPVSGQHQRRAGPGARTYPTWAPKLCRPCAPGRGGGIGGSTSRAQGRERAPRPGLIQLGRPSCAAGSLPVQAPASGKSGSGPAHGREPAPRSVLPTWAPKLRLRLPAGTGAGIREERLRPSARP